MAKAYDIFNYDSAIYGVMRDPTRRATQACQNANRALDTLKERVLIEFGLPNTSEYIHNLAHWFPPFFDRIGDILHQRHLTQEYPETPEYKERPADLDGVFGEIIRLLDEVQNALHQCVVTADDNNLHPLGRQFENLEADNSKLYEQILYAWNMFDASEDSATSYDNWVSQYLLKDWTDEH